ncbi:MAG TPA: hypothetical protein VFG45_07480 [Candidatus Nitrosocosmicus sp.]|nr:hypothetical protein [Candidatus Nitrosocosmicus sp.]
MSTKICQKAMPNAPSTIKITPMTANTIPRILAIFVATGGNILAIAYKIIPIIRTIIPSINPISVLLI